MTTVFDSFDASPMGDDFNRSHLGARNMHKLYGIIFITGGKYYDNNVSAAESDVRSWNIFLAENPTATASAAPAQLPEGDIWPIGVPWPERITRIDITPTLPSNDVDRLYEDITTDILRKPFSIPIKISGPVPEGHDYLEPGISQLLTRLTRGGWVFDLHEAAFSRWLASLRSNLEAQIA